MGYIDRELEKMREMNRLARQNIQTLSVFLSRTFFSVLRAMSLSHTAIDDVSLAQSRIVTEPCDAWKCCRTSSGHV